MSGNGGRRQVRQRTSKDAAYAKRLQDARGPPSVSSSSNRRTDATSTGGSSNNNNEPSAAGSASTGTSAGRKRQRSPATNGAPSLASSGPAGSAASDSIKRPRQRGPGPGWACTRCTLHNTSRKRICEACRTAKPTVTAGMGTVAEAEAETSTVTSEHASGDGGGKKRARASNDEDNADGHGDGKPRTDATSTTTADASSDRTESTPFSSRKSRGKSHSSSGNSVSEWLRKVKKKNQQGGKSSSSKGGCKGDKGSSSRSKSKSSSSRSKSSGSSRSRSKSPIPPPAAAATAAATAYDIPESRHSDDEGLNRQDVKVVRVRVFDRCRGQGQGIGGSDPSQQRRELSNSGPLEAKVPVDRPKLCATREEIKKKDAAHELPPAEPCQNEEAVPTDATADSGVFASKNDTAQGAASLASPSSGRAPSSAAIASHHPGVNTDVPPGTTNDIMPINPLPAKSTGVNKEFLYATIQDQSSTIYGSSDNIIDEASTHVPSQADPDEAQATEEAGSMKTDQVKTGEVEGDQYQPFSYDFEVTDKVEAGAREAEASPRESGSVLSGRPAEEETVGSNEAHGEKIATDDKAIDPGATAPTAETSRLEATRSSSSEIIAQSIGTEAQSETQRDLSASNEDESRQEAQMSQESNDNYDAFQPLTQAVPLFEYGYDLTQQQEEEFQQEPALSYPEEQVDADTTTTIIADIGTGSIPEAENQDMPAVEEEQHFGSMASAEAETMPKADRISAVPLFSTGGGASISISDEAMARANQMFEEPSSNHGETNTSTSDSNQTPADSCAVTSGPASLFLTAGGSSISISAEAMKRADNLFSDPEQEQQMKEPKEPALGGGLALFSTAGGSSISVSKDSMEKVAHLFDGQTSGCQGTAVQPGPTPKAPAASARPALFSTAGGKEIEVSDEALASTSDLFDKEDQYKTIRPSSPLVPSPPSANIDRSTKAKAPIETPGASTVDYGLGLATQSPMIAKNSAPIFSTAGKKREIVVDPRAVARANELLGLDENQGQPSQSSAKPALFSTAGKGLAVEVSEESLSKANQIFEGSDGDIGMGAPGASQMGPPSGAATLFFTAGGSSISVTADAVAKASEIFGGAVQQALVASSKSSPVVPSVAVPPAAAALFSTAGGSSIAVSDDAITRAGQRLDNTGQIQHSPPPLPPPPAAAAAAAAEPRAPASSAVALFSTAGGASISISDDAMAKANQMFTGSDKDQSSSLSAQAAQRASTLKANQIFAGPTNEAPSSTVAKSSASLFSTAGGSSIAVSDDAMAKANQMLTEVAKAPHSSSSSSSSQPKSSMGALSLFSTAGGASIKVSDDALAKANHMFRMEVDKETSIDDPNPPSSESMPPPMFSTVVNNQTISVSEQGLAKANEIFGGTRQKEIRGPTISAAAMFATAGQGASISISDDALAKANEMFAQNSSLDFSGSNQGEAKDTRGSARPRIHFAETPAQPAMRKRTNRSSLGGTAAKNVNIAQHMHPAETPLPTIARGGAGQAPSTKKVLFREDNYQDRSQSHSDRESSGAPAGPNVAIASTTAATAAVAFTPKHTPQVSRKPVAVTRSTIVRNPYAKRPDDGPDTSPKSSSLSSVTPVPFAFKHVEGTFSGKKFSPKTLERAARILEEQPSSHPSRHPSRKSGYCSGMASASTTSRRPRHLEMDGEACGKMKLDGSDFQFSIDGTRLSLQEFDDIYGPMEDANHQACIDGGANPVLLKISSVNASKLRFDEQTGLPYAMFGAGNALGCKMVGNVQDLRRDLISKGCDEALLVDKWIVNHFGWINWKLACTERRYPQALAGKYFTYEHVLSQLKGRYDREVAGAKRPALRIILNRDASAGRLMILCVAQIHRFRIKIGSDDSSSGESNSPRPSSSKSFREELRLELTDGWYSVQAVLDSHLQSFVEQDKIKVGTKLLVAGAELAGSEDGVDPLDASYQPSRSSCPVALKLVANATRRAKWDSRLGFVRPTHQIQSQDGLLLVKSMGDVIPGGGPVPLMDLIVCRRFPRSFLEKGPDGTSTILTEAQEEKRRREFDERRHRAIEKISEAAEKECTREVDEQAPEQWRQMMASNAMCDYYERLSKDDKIIVDRWEERRSSMINDMTRRMIDAKMQSNVSLFRSSTPFLRITVKSLQNSPPPSFTTDEDEDKERIIPNQPSATLTVWRMTEDQSNILKEGTVIRIKDLAVKSELRDEMLQFSANDKTRMQALVQQPSSRQLQYSGFSRRSFAPIVRAHVLSRKASSGRTASGAHMDFAGVLVRSEHEQHSMVHTSFSYFTDESGLLLRLQRDLDPNDESALLGWNKVLELGQVLAFKDVLVLPFDSKANCAVVSWSQPTLQEKKGHLNDDRRIKSLQKWTESEDAERTCSTVLASFDAGVPLYCRLPQRTEIAMGYILCIRPRNAADVVGGNEYGGQYRSVSKDHSFEIDIDCGGGSNLITATCSRAVLSQTIEMHLDPASHDGTALDLRDDLLRQGGGNASEYLAPCDMTNLNLLFTESGVLFQVTLRKQTAAAVIPQTASLEILQISPANVSALAALYLEALK